MASRLPPESSDTSQPPAPPVSSPLRRNPPRRVGVGGGGASAPQPTAAKAPIRFRIKKHQSASGAADDSDRDARSQAMSGTLPPESSDTPATLISSPPPRRNPSREASRKTSDLRTSSVTMTSSAPTRKNSSLGVVSLKHKPGLQPLHAQEQLQALSVPNDEAVVYNEAYKLTTRKKADSEWPGAKSQENLAEVSRRSTTAKEAVNDTAGVTSLGTHSNTLEIILSKHVKMFTESQKGIIGNFTRTLKELTSDKILSNVLHQEGEALKAALNLAAAEYSSRLAVELAGKIPTAAFPVIKGLALVYDEGMLLHEPQDAKYREKPERLKSIMSQLKKEKLSQRCDLFKCDEASYESLLSVHTSTHIDDIMSVVSKDQIERDKLANQHCRLGDIYYSEGSTKAALLAAGGTIKACTLVAQGIYKYAFAVVRPPGHHAGNSGPSGFCLLNNIAIGAAHIINNYKRKILIVDWDVHHGNGTQEIFYGTNQVLFFSVHRADDSFYPASGSTSAANVGKNSGFGYNVNVCWDHEGIRDVDFITVWEHVLIPLMESFEPDIILISAGFDAADGDPLGGCCVTPNGFATLLHMMMKFGDIVMVLEGGYKLTSTSKCKCSLSTCVAECIKILLGDNSGLLDENKDEPFDTTWATILETRKKLQATWRIYEKEIPVEITSKSIPYEPQEY